MLGYDQQNLLKGLKSTNKIAALLFNNRDLKLKVLKYLKDWAAENNNLPATSFQRISEVLDIVEPNWKTININQINKG